jgi:hypothetical protein
MEYTVCLLTWDNILALFEKVQKRIVLVMPAIHEEWVTAINELNANQNLEIWICFDNQEKAFRNGYGDVKAIEGLHSKGAFIKQAKDLKIGFVQVDDEAFALFVESRIFSGNPEGLNAISLPQSLAQEICQSIFPEKFVLDLFYPIPESVEKFDKADFQRVKKAIEDNPPASPDLQREISVYTNHFQFVELRLDGGNLTGKAVTIPSEALPFKDATLKAKMRTRYNLFEKEDTDKWVEIKDIKEKIEAIREKYLVACSVRKGKRILKKNEKADFLKAIVEIEKLIQKNFEAIKGRVTKAIEGAELSLAKELQSFLETFPPDSVTENDSEEMRKFKISKAVNSILSQTKFPVAEDLITRLKMDQHFYDLTWEDLQDEDLIKWFQDNDLISPDLENQLANFSQAFEAKL